MLCIDETTNFGIICSVASVACKCQLYYGATESVQEKKFRNGNLVVSFSKSNNQPLSHFTFIWNNVQIVECRQVTLIKHSDWATS